MRKMKLKMKTMKQNPQKMKQLMLNLSKISDILRFEIIEIFT